MALNAYHLLRCRDSSRVDLRGDEQGVPHFLEINPIAGLHPTRSDLLIMMRMQGFSYDDCIKQIVTAALQRLGFSHK
jgi:D-alanine-D-alanine ligase